MDTAIEALAALRREGADVPAGHRRQGAGRDGRAGGRYRVSPGRVRFMGSVDEMDALFAAADVLVHPTRWDACSLSTIEAGAAGLPVITTARTARPELIREDADRLRAGDPEDVAALAGPDAASAGSGAAGPDGGGASAAAPAHDVPGRTYEAVEAVLLANSRGRSARAAGP